MDALSIYTVQSPAHPLHLRQLGTYAQDLGFLVREREREKEISSRKTLNLIQQMEGTLNPLQMAAVHGRMWRTCAHRHRERERQRETEREN